MRLASLTIYNMFSYYGVSTIRFDQNTTCIIGTNGFGKTSILNAIKLCLGDNKKIDIESVINNNAEDSRCYVSVVFDEFTVTREWRFEKTVEEKLVITHDDGSIQEDAEAEHFLQNKIPSFLVDFLFYDGEVGDNLLLLSNARLKSIFDFIFDLDLLENSRKDSLEVAKKLLEQDASEETKNIMELEKTKDKYKNELDDAKKCYIDKEKELKHQTMELQKVNTQIRNKNKKTKSLYEKLDKIKSEMIELREDFREIILWQMPLLLNQKLYKKMQKKAKQAVAIKDEALFSNKLNKFITELDTPMDKAHVYELFESIMLKDSKIGLSTTPAKYKKLINKMKELKLSEKQILADIKDIETSIMNTEVVSKLFMQRDEQEKNIDITTQELSTLDDKISELSANLKETDRELTNIFKTNQDKYANLKGYKELKSIARVSEVVYKKRLFSNLEVFNDKLKKNTSNFLNQYEHIDTIQIDEHHNIVISDGEKKLDTKLLSAGQKQVLNFLIVKTILEFKKFASFVVIDTPFGRLSNKNRDLLLSTCYLEFDFLVLLLTDSEYEFVKAQNLKYSHYEIQRTLVGSKIESVA